MLLITHILIALTSVAWTSYVMVSPSRPKISGSWAMVAATLITGTALVVSSSQHILQACITGLIYTAVVTTGIVIAQRRLVHQQLD